MATTFIHSELTGIILKAFYKVNNTLGYGFLEKVYENSLLVELHAMGIECSNELPINVYYENHLVGTYCADILVKKTVIIKIKAVEHIAPEHEVQLVNILKATEIEVGLLLNFGPKPQHARRVLTHEYLNRIKTQIPPKPADSPSSPTHPFSPPNE